MRDIELYRAILGLPAPLSACIAQAGWTVSSVDLDVKGQQVVVQVEAGPGPFPCPECGTAWPRYDSRPRRWRHLDTCQFTTWIEAPVPRVEYATHGLRQIQVPGAEPGSPFTALFERWAIDLLLSACGHAQGRRYTRREVHPHTHTSPRLKAKIVFDRFHVAKHVPEAVEAVRKAEHRARKRRPATSG